MAGCKDYYDDGLENHQKEKEFKAIFMGAHGVANGLDKVLDAAGELKNRGRKDIKLLFIGDGKLKPALKKRAVSEYLDNCLFLDPIPKNKIPDLLQQIDAGMIIENRCGIAVPPENPTAFADALEYMTDNRDEAIEMGKNARSLAERNFNRFQLTERFADWLEQNAKAQRY